MQLGRIWTVLVIAQVAVAVAVLPAAVHSALITARYALAEPGFAASEHLQAWLSMERTDMPAGADADAGERAFSERFAIATSQLTERLLSDASVARTTLAAFPVNSARQIRVDVPAATGSVSEVAAWNRVAPNYFELFNMPLLAGRLLGPGDATDEASAVVVDRLFVEQVLGGASAVGVTLHYRAPAGVSDEMFARDRVFEIVGVVENFPHGNRMVDRLGVLYSALDVGKAHAHVLFVQLRGVDASGYDRRLREAAFMTDAALEVDDPIPMDEAGREHQRMMRMVAIGVLLATLSVLLLSAAGIYAMMAFAVSRRQREIGIRAALGAPPARLLHTMFARAGAQLAVGVGIGMIMAVLLDFGIEGSYATIIPAVAI